MKTSYEKTNVVWLSNARQDDHLLIRQSRYFTTSLGHFDSVTDIRQGWFLQTLTDRLVYSQFHFSLPGQSPFRAMTLRSSHNSSDLIARRIEWQEQTNSNQTSIQLSR